MPVTVAQANVVSDNKLLSDVSGVSTARRMENCCWQLQNKNITVEETV